MAISPNLGKVDPKSVPLKQPLQESQRPTWNIAQGCCQALCRLTKSGKEHISTNQGGPETGWMSPNALVMSVFRTGHTSSSPPVGLRDMKLGDRCSPATFQANQETRKVHSNRFALTEITKACEFVSTRTISFLLWG